MLIIFVKNIKMTKEDIAKEIMNQFAKENSKPNHVIQLRWITQVLIPRLNPKEQLLVNPAINDLVNDGLVTVEERSGQCLVLTEKGFDLIYPIDENRAIENIGKMIMQRFVETKSKVNHVIDSRWINLTLLKRLNPKETALVEKAITQLVEEGLITTEDRHGFCLVLTQKGFDSIY